MRASQPSKPRFRVLVPHIVYPTDPAVIMLLLAGEQLDPADRGDVMHVAGHVVDDVPACSVERLLADGEIERADDAELQGDGVPMFVAVGSDAIDEATWADLGRPADDADKGEQ